jgi:hypothetical protein
MFKCAPIVVYTYDRIDHLKLTIAALRGNHLACESDIFIVSDAAKSLEKVDQILDVRNYVEEIAGFKSVNKIFRDVNFGSFDSIAKAEDMVISDYGKVISLEDDIVTSKNFLDFINQGLNYYEADDNALTIAGYCHPIQVPHDHLFDSWLSPWHCPWGYGTWKNKYSRINKSLNPLSELMANKKLRKYLYRNGNFFVDTLYSDYSKQIKALDARICAQMIHLGMYTVMPSVSKVFNIGCDGSGLHCEKTTRFDTSLDLGTKINFNFYDKKFSIDEKIVKNYLKFMNGNSFQVMANQFLRRLRQTYLYGLLKAIYKNYIK